MYCSNCGKKLSPDDFFCSNCGTPVLRQGLFDEDSTSAADDAFEETRLFTAEELGKYLNEFDDEPVQPEAPQPAAAQREPEAARPVQEASAKKDAAAKAAAAEMMGAASAFAGRFRGKLDDLKAKQAEKKQAQAEAKAAAAAATPEPEPEPIASYDDIDLIDDAPAESEPVSPKKIVLPVIILGLIIGLVIGLVLTQPWSNDEEETTDTTTVSTIIMVE